jgi:hypothetical protein
MCRSTVDAELGCGSCILGHYREGLAPSDRADVDGLAVRDAEAAHWRTTLSRRARPSAHVRSRLAPLHGESTWLYANDYSGVICPAANPGLFGAGPGDLAEEGRSVERRTCASMIYMSMSAVKYRPGRDGQACAVDGQCDSLHRTKPGASLLRRNRSRSAPACLID